MPLAQDDESFRYTAAEAKMISRLAQVRVRADVGNRAAKAQIARLGRQVAALSRRARKGDVRAARAVRVYTESGILEPSQTFAMEGAEDTRTKPVSAQLRDQAFLLRKQANQLMIEQKFDTAKTLIAQAEALEKQAAALDQAAFAAMPKRPAPSGLSPYPWVWARPWNGWHVGRVNVFNVGLLAVAGYFAWKKRWLPAAVPAGGLALNLALGSKFVEGSF